MGNPPKIPPKKKKRGWLFYFSSKFGFIFFIMVSSNFGSYGTDPDFTAAIKRIAGNCG